LAALYGTETVAKAQSLISRETRFFDLPDPGIELQGCLMHQRLLDAYAKVHRRHAIQPSASPKTLR
jgi:ribosomal protein S12 methylthiotransferase accessory factor